MAVKINKYTLNTVLLFILTFFTLVFPRDNYNIKKFSLIIFVLYNIVVVVNSYKKDYWGIFLTVFLPLNIGLVSYVQNGNIGAILSSLYIYLYFSIAYIIFKYKLNIKRILLIVGNIIAVIIFVSAIIDALHIISYTVNPVLNFLAANREAQISVSQYAIAYYVFFLKGSPILLYNLMYYLNKRKYIASILMFASILFTGTRANIGMAAFILVMYIVFVEKNKIIQIAVGLIGITIIIVYGSQIIESISTINYAKRNGDQIRVETVNAIMAYLTKDGLNLVTGAGFGSSYMMTVGNRIGEVMTSEMSYLEIYRQTGLIFGTLIMFFILFPLTRLYKIDKTFFFFYCSYLIEAFFEPFIFTSTGFFIIAIIYAEVFSGISSANSLFIQKNVQRKIYYNEITS